MTFHWSGGRVGLNCRIIREEDKVIVEEINHGFINDGYDDYLYEDTGLIQLLIITRQCSVFCNPLLILPKLHIEYWCSAIGIIGWSYQFYHFKFNTIIA